MYIPLRIFVQHVAVVLRRQYIHLENLVASKDRIVRPSSDFLKMKLTSALIKAERGLAARRCRSFSLGQKVLTTSWGPLKIEEFQKHRASIEASPFKREDVQWPPHPLKKSDFKEERALGSHLFHREDGPRYTFLRRLSLRLMLRFNIMHDVILWWLWLWYQLVSLFSKVSRK